MPATYQTEIREKLLTVRVMSTCARNDMIDIIGKATFKAALCKCYGQLRNRTRNLSQVQQNTTCLSLSVLHIVQYHAFIEFQRIYSIKRKPIFLSTFWLCA